MSSNILRKFNEEITNLIGSFVSVVTSNGNKYKGKLIGITENLNLVIDNIESKEEKLYKIVLNGNFVSEIGLLSEPFNLKALGERLEKVFPGLVKIHEDIKAIIVMDKIKVTDKDKGITTYTITKFITNSQLSNATFNFNKKDHPNVEVIDLR